MFTQEYRPARFKDVIGQAEAVATMKAVVKNPETAPRSYIFQGERGLGKTTLSRVFSRALLCENPQDGDACLACPTCLSFADYGTSFQEYDATQVGKADFMRSVTNHLFYSSTGAEGYRVVVFDEIQAASPQAQAALLKILEEGPRDTFFLMATTDIDDVIPTVQSRSVQLAFFPLLDVEMKSFLIKVCERENMEPVSEVLDRIVSFSFGHVRDAMMKLDLYKLIGSPEEFVKLIYVPEKEIIEMFLAIKRQDRPAFLATVRVLASSPLAYLRKTFELFLLNSLRVFSGELVAAFPAEYAEFIKLYGAKAFEILALMSKDWVYNCFKSDLAFQALVWYLYNTLGQAEKTPAEGLASRFKK